jgi:hypothetical protein
MSNPFSPVPVRVATLLCAALLLLALTTSADLQSGKVAQQAGKWKVLRDVDPMTDKVVCTGIYGDSYAIQLVADKLYISVRGGAESLTLRFDDKEPHPLRLATDLEKKVNAYIIDGSDFAELATSHRLRYQIGTLVAGLVHNDLDLTGIGEALESIKAGCPTGTSPPPTKAPIAKQDADRGNSLCTAGMVSKMEERGLNGAQISEICKPDTASASASAPPSTAAAGQDAAISVKPASVPPAETPGFRRVAVVGTFVSYPYTVEIPSDWQVHDGKPLKTTLFLAPPAVINADLYPNAIGVAAGTVSLANPEQVAVNIQRNLKGAKTAMVREIDGVRGVLAEFDQGDGVTASTVLSLMLPTVAGCVQFIGRSPRAQFAAHRAQYERILFSVRRAQ